MHGAEFCAVYYCSRVLSTTDMLSYKTVGVIMSLAKQEVTTDLKVVLEDLVGAGSRRLPWYYHVRAFIQNVYCRDLFWQCTFLDNRFLANEFVLLLADCLVVDPVDPAHLIIVKIFEQEAGLLPGNRLYHLRRLAFIYADPVLGRFWHQSFKYFLIRFVIDLD